MFKMRENTVENYEAGRRCGVMVDNNLTDKLKLNRNRYIEMIDTYLEEPHSISREWVELLKIMREIIEGEGRNES